MDFASSRPQEIANAAAQFVVDEGMDYGQAKRRALRHLGLPANTALPGNEALDEAVRMHLALFESETQPQELAILRAHALLWMARLADFRPFVTGPVWFGTANAHSEVMLQLFCDDPKMVDFCLLDRGVSYDAGVGTGIHGRSVTVLRVESRERLTSAFPSAAAESALGSVGIRITVYDYDDLRGALKPDARGQAPRGDAQALARRMEADAAPGAQAVLGL